MVKNNNNKNNNLVPTKNEFKMISIGRVAVMFLKFHCHESVVLIKQGILNRFEKIDHPREVIKLQRSSLNKVYLHQKKTSRDASK